MKDYAKPQSFAYQVHYIQRRRKKRKSGGDEPLPPPTPVQRYITDFNAAAGSYLSLDQTINLTGNFEIEFYGTFSANGFYLTARRTDANSRMLVFGSRLYLEGAIQTSTFSDSSWIGDGKLHRLSVLRSGTVIQVLIDGNFIASVTTSTTVSIQALLSQFGASTSVPYFDGHLLEVSLWAGGTRDTVAKTNYWDISSDGSGSTETDSVSGNNLTRVNLSAADTGLFTLNEIVTPNQWENGDQSVVLPIASTEVYY